MIEADIVYGRLIDDPTEELQPIMAHPPLLTSDITLKSFLTQVLNFNKGSSNDKQKGVKLDFKSTDVYESSLPMLIELWETMDYPVWINADIYKGPLNNTLTVPVDAQIFFKGTKSLPNATLSTGWTTRWGSDFTDGNYTMEQVDEMIAGINTNNVTNSITFPVRAGIAAQSITQLDHLYNSLKDSNRITFTIWSSTNDSVDVEKLRKFIFHFGIDKVYIDVNSDLSQKLRLDHNFGLSLQPNIIVSLLLVFASILFLI